jgi:hypothetical protein
MSWLEILLFAAFYLISIAIYARYVLPRFSHGPAKSISQKLAAVLLVLPLVPTGLLPAVITWLLLKRRSRDVTRESQGDFDMANFCAALTVFFWPVLILFPFA